MSALARGVRNPFRNRFRTAVVVLLLALVIGLFAVLVQGALATREKLEALQAGVRTVVELREAGRVRHRRVRRGQAGRGAGFLRCATG